MHLPGRTGRGSPARPNFGHDRVDGWSAETARPAREQGCRVLRCDAAKHTAGCGLMRFDIPDARGALSTTHDDFILVVLIGRLVGGRSALPIFTTPAKFGRSGSRGQEGRQYTDGHCYSVLLTLRKAAAGRRRRGKGRKMGARHESEETLHFRYAVTHIGVHHAGWNHAPV